MTLQAVSRYRIEDEIGRGGMGSSIAGRHGWAVCRDQAAVGRIDR
jgi:hypothetical protein